MKSDPARDEAIVRTGPSVASTGVASTSGGTDRLILFLHTHKCAGTSVNALFRDHSEYQLAPDNLAAMTPYLQGLRQVKQREHLDRHYGSGQLAGHLAYLRENGIRYVSTEWFAPPMDWLEPRDKLFVFTVIREPLSRYISNYHFDVDRGYSSAKDIWSFRDNRAFRRYNYYTRFFSSRLVDDSSPVLENDYQSAVHYLDRTDAVIIQEEPSSFGALEQLGVDVKNLGVKNRSGSERLDIPTDFIEQFQELASWDYLLYEHARALCARQLAATPAIAPTVSPQI